MIDVTDATACLPPKLTAIFEFVSIAPRKSLKDRDKQRVPTLSTAVNPSTMIEPETLKNIKEIQERQESQSPNVKTQMNQIGFCGIPSLWVSQDELFSQKYIS